VEAIIDINHGRTGSPSTLKVGEIAVTCSLVSGWTAGGAQHVAGGSALASGGRCFDIYLS
jgi:hypothetical protein